MKKKLPEDLQKCCALCEHATKIELSGDILCTKAKNLKRVTEDDVCRHFSFDILSYKPSPTKIPKFTIDGITDIL